MSSPQYLLSAWRRGPQAAKELSCPLSPLPDEPSFEQLRKQAKDLQRAVAGDAEALAELAERVPDSAFDQSDPSSFRLSVAAARSRTSLRLPELDPTQAPCRGHRAVQPLSVTRPGRPAGDPATEFLQAACLSYEDDGPTRWDEARELLAAHPEVVAGNVYVASVVGDVAALGRVPAVDSAAATREGGPYRWEPLVYLAYARHDPAIARARYWRLRACSWPRRRPECRLPVARSPDPVHRPHRRVRRRRARAAPAAATSPFACARPLAARSRRRRQRRPGALQPDVRA